MTACCVPFCKGRSRKDWREWVCGRHWRQVSRETRSAYRRAWRVVDQSGDPWRHPGGSPERLEAVRNLHTAEALWERCKVEAIEAGMGIG